MTDLRKAAEMALDAMRLYVTMYPQMDKGYMVDARETLRQALAQPEQEPKPAFTKFVISNEQYEIVPTTNALTQRIEYLEAEVKCEEKRFNDLWDSFAALVNKKPWIGLTDFDDPKVQAVYEILCNDEAPPKGEHWEGFMARRIVDALAQPEKEPVAYADPLDLAKDCNWDTFICQHSSENHEGTRFKIPLYTAPPRKPWQGLTDEEMLEIWRQHGSYEMLFKKVEIKLKDKNTT